MNDRPVPFSYKFAVACGLLPMAAGTIIFLVWLFSDLPSLELAGILVVQAGLVLFVAGFASLFLFARKRRSGRGTMPVLLLLLANFPLCAVYGLTAYSMETAYFVSIINNSGGPVENLTLTDPAGVSFVIARVEPGETRRLCPAFSGEGSVRYAYTSGQETGSDILLGYITGSLGGTAELVFSQGSKPQVRELPGRIPAGDFFAFCLAGPGDGTKLP